MADMNKINNIEKHLTNEELGKVNGGRREKIELPEVLTEEDKELLKRLTNIKLGVNNWI